MTNESKSHRGGRAVLPRAERRTHVYCFGMNDAEFYLLTDRLGVDPAGISSRSLGRLIARHARQAALTREPNPVPELNRIAWVDLSRAAANLNQIVKKMHDEDDRVSALAGEIYGELAEFRLALLGAHLDRED